MKFTNILISGRKLSHCTFHLGFPSVSDDTSSRKNDNSPNMVSHTSKCEWPRADVAASCSHRNHTKGEKQFLSICAVIANQLLVECAENIFNRSSLHRNLLWLADTKNIDGKNEKEQTAGLCDSNIICKAV